MVSRKYLTGTFLAILALFLIKVTPKNSCTSFFDYFLINFGGNCFYNPDVDLSVPEIIKKYATIPETYSVTTEDGYILTIFRIPTSNPVGVVLLQPPMSAGAITWLSDGAQSLAISLWNEGYDVWLNNHRGTSYSRKHLNLSETDPKFWDYSFHEMALYDLDAQFELIHKKTNSRVIFIGYSMSSTVGLTYAAVKPENSKKYVKSYILIAPVVHMKSFSSPFKYIFYLMAPFESVFRMGEFFTFEAMRWLGQFINLAPMLMNIAGSIVMGWTLGEMDPVLFPYIFAHHGRGITNKMLYHYGQIFFNQSGFNMYDYGATVNSKIYGSEWPPIYPLHNIISPIYFIYGTCDYLASPLDVDSLCDVLPQKELGKIQLANFNHIDFVFGKRRKISYKTIHQILKYVEIKT